MPLTNTPKQTKPVEVDNIKALQETLLEALLENNQCYKIWEINSQNIQINSYVSTNLC